MKKVQLNFQEMVASVLAHAKAHPDAWRGVEPVELSIGELDAVDKALDTTAGKQGRNDGQTSVKNHRLSDLFEVVQKNAQKVASYARRQHDELLEAQVSVRAYELERMSEAEALRRCAIVIAKAKEAQPGMRGYRLGEDDITNLEALYAAAENVKDEVRDSRSDGPAQTAKIAQLESEARRILESLDLEVESMIDDDDFVDGYFVARRVFDRRGRSAEQADTPRA